MVQVLILICPVSIAVSVCQLDTAIDIITSTDVYSPIECMMKSEIIVAQAQLLHTDQYVKVRCQSFGKEIMP